MNYEGFLIVLIRLIWKVIAPPPTGQVAARPSLSLSSSGKRPVLSNKVGDAEELVEHAMSLLASTIVSRPELLRKLYHCDTVNFEDFLIKSLTCSEKVLLPPITSSALRSEEHTSELQSLM